MVIEIRLTSKFLIGKVFHFIVVFLSYSNVSFSSCEMFVLKYDFKLNINRINFHFLYSGHINNFESDSRIGIDFNFMDQPIKC